MSSYSCATIERFFFIKGIDKRPVISRETLSKYLVNILEPVCYLLKTQQNLYGIRTLYRVIVTAGPDVLPLAQTLAQMFSLYLEAVVAQPSNQTFVYMLFECIGLSIKLTKDHDMSLSTLEGYIAPIMFDIISKSIPELISYTFQILSMFVIYKKDLQENYQVLII